MSPKPDVGDKILFRNNPVPYTVEETDVDILPEDKGIKLSFHYDGIRYACWLTWDRYYDWKPETIKIEEAA